MEVAQESEVQTVQTGTVLPVRHCNDEIMRPKSFPKRETEIEPVQALLVLSKLLGETMTKSNVTEAVKTEVATTISGFTGQFKFPFDAAFVTATETP